jgi:hypothetical protein
LGAASEGGAVIFYDGTKEATNVSAPGGALTDSGWQYLGLFDNYIGVPIGPHHFITAKHVGGAAGSVLFFQGNPYTTTGFADEPGHDLRIWEVSGTFPTYAPLYNGSDEAGKPLVVFGRGTQRGDPVLRNPPTPDGYALRGWLWGTSDNVLRWGENDVTSAVDLGPGIGDTLYATFDRLAYDGGKLNESTLSAGDSGGGVFIEKEGNWLLAGIVFGVDGGFKINPGDPDIRAAIFDAGGLYYDFGGVDLQLPDGPNDLTTGFYATRISAHYDWIGEVAGVPEAGTGCALAVVGLAVAAGWCRGRRTGLIAPKR